MTLAERQQSSTKTGEDNTGLVCKVCAPEMHFLQCHVCCTTKPAPSFPQRERADDVKIRRCWMCFKCRDCGQKYGDQRSFYGTAYCSGCRKKTCDVCKEAKSRSNFSESQLHNAKTRNTHVRCKACHVCEDCKSPRRAEDFDKINKQCRKCVNAQRLNCLLYTSPSPRD